jgi:hypothetical protein
MEVSFVDHVRLLQQYLTARGQIVENIERRLLNVGKAAAHNRDRDFFNDALNACFLDVPALPGHLSRLSGQLAAAHLADGFEPAPQDGYSRALDPVELVLRAHHHWNRERWPGKNGRIVYAQTLFTVSVLGQLEHLSLRIWDEGWDAASERLREVQRLLDALNTAAAGPLVRDARWLIQTAQGPLTRHLKPYFTMADRIAGLFTESDRVEIHRAGVLLAGGHMRSQLRHRSDQTGWAADDPQLLAMTHLSNSMDMALLVRDLIPLLEAYSEACAQDHDDDARRLALADAILQGLSADPELLLRRPDLLAPMTMIEDLVVEQDVKAKRYGELIAQTAGSLKNDATLFDPSQTAYSPLGIVYGFCADILSNMALNTLGFSAPAGLSLEDMFSSREGLEQKRDLAQAWQGLPRAEGEREPFEHSTKWAAWVFARLLTAFNASNLPRGRLYVVPRGVAIGSLAVGLLPAGIASAQEHCLTSDAARARETGSTALPKSRLIGDKAEGRFLASSDSAGEFFGVTKALLTIYVSQGKDALVADIPPAVIDGLHRTCPELLVVA